MAKYDRRKERNGAVGDLNGLAEEAGLDKVDYRVADLYVRLAAAGLPPSSIERLRSARARWCDNGGGELDEGLLAGEAPEDDEEGVPGHYEVRAKRGKPFRLRARAFMLTFNSLAFTLSPDLWLAFHQWVQERIGCCCFYVEMAIGRSYCRILRILRFWMDLFGVSGILLRGSCRRIRCRIPEF